MIDDKDFAIIESAEDVLSITPTNSSIVSGAGQRTSMTIEERISNNYYIEEFISLDNVTTLRQKALKEGLRSSRFRSICWRMFLDCLPEHKKGYVERVRTLRKKYADIQRKYSQNPREHEDEDIGTDNPLSQNETSHWNQYFSDDELKQRINKDVVRAFPDITFFQDTTIQNLMSSILFFYARENAQLEYKQGMHEILAPLIFVIHCDHQAYLFAQDKGLVEEEIKEILNPQYLEHDSYFMFVHVMERIESWYDNSSVKTVKKNEYVNLEPFSNDLDFNCYSKIGVKLKMINEQLLRRTDEKLYNHLKDLRIAPQIYGIRWMRLLFIREFQMQDLLVLWDAIFADGIALCDYIFTAMLLVISPILLPCDYSNSLNHLMRYPSVCDVHYVIHLALHIRDPLKYPQPVGHSTFVLPNPSALRMQRANTRSSPTTSPSKQQNSTLGHRARAQTSIENSRSSKISELKPMAFEWVEERPSGAAHIEDITAQRELENLRYRMDFCARHMSKGLETVQAFVSKNTDCAESESALVAIAELKKIRDILGGTIAFENNLH